MTAIGTLPGVVSESSLKPTRTMTYPLLDPRGNGARAKAAKKGEPLDPEELSHRLNQHLAEQRLKTERRREVRALKAAALAQQNVYHHVPTAAASAFERTTNPDATRQVHALSKPTVDIYFKLPSLEAHVPGHAYTNLQKTQAIDQAMQQKEMMRNRNQFQWNHGMEEANYADTERDLYRMPKRDFNLDFVHHKADWQAAPRPLSTSNACWRKETPGLLAKLKGPLKPQHDGLDRHDWTQLEEVETKKKRRTNPFLRKMESTWILRGRKGKMSVKQDTGSSNSLSPEEEGHRRGSLLALLRRHPS
ncbi:uncharacterized protein RAG0_07283 [Rhynchosporium agropyri]|uniref:Uncharacterized protein n=1 Tax=Rhynchosporium agropyri TaxID=914238 RepID=A0A1E1KKY8_9HELO|nr:uncharacterized protein RAG0_07283 [Rhynchosporium agropyri]